MYADTSVSGGVFDAEYSASNSAFFDRVKSGGFRLVVSPVIRPEISPAPRAVKDLYEEFTILAEVVDLTPAAAELQSAYIEHRIVSPKYEADALHVALASVSGCDALVSWNMRHIVQMNRIRGYNAVNELL